MGAFVSLGGCALSPPYEPWQSETARESYDYCQQGATCTLKPMAMIVLNKANPAISFDYRSWILYDPRPVPIGQRYIAFMNEMNDPVCEGYYPNLVINITALIAMTCFPREARGRGRIRFDALQNNGRFAGKSTGTGTLETDSEIIFFVHGATPDENQRASFWGLWDKYGGKNIQPLTPVEANQKRVPSLPRLVRSRPPPPSAAADNR